jgi:protein-arginine kinase activator protein McsA
MNDLASKLEFEDAALIRDEINRLRAKQMGLNKKALEYRK